MNKILNQENSFRKARTRTLIQVGGLVEKAGLIEVFGIELGDDLQSDLADLDKAATLLGCLMEVAEGDFDNPQKQEAWHKAGVQLLKPKDKAS